MFKNSLITVPVLLSLMLVGCNKPPQHPLVLTVGGEQVGEVHVTDTDNAVILDTYKSVKAKVRGDLVRTADGEKIGIIRNSDDGILILNDKGIAIGRLDSDFTCYQGRTLIGRISEKIDEEAAGGACLVLLMTL